MRRAWGLLLVVVGCDQAADPCANTVETCVALSIDTTSPQAIKEIDQLEIDVLHGQVRGTATTRVADGPVTLPVLTAIDLTLATAEPTLVGVVVAGKLRGAVVGLGAGTTAVIAGQQVVVPIDLAQVDPCIPNAFYCGGTELPGDPDTLYRCRADGVPAARARCMGGCIVSEGDDACRGVGGRCIETGFYCGGDKVDGDPHTLYRCEDGAGVFVEECLDGCVVALPGNDDDCRR